jgi:ornithine decarboxylase
MTEAKFVLSKKKLLEDYKKLRDFGLNVCYSFKTNNQVGEILKKETKDCDFSIHSNEEIDIFSKEDFSRVWFFTQAESKKGLIDLLNKGIRKFVIDNEKDLQILLNVINEKKIKIFLSVRMKFQEHRIGSGKYFVYGMPSKKVNEIIENVSEEKFIEKIGIHIHRKSQNISEWEIKKEILDSIKEDNLVKISFLNLGGGLPAIYRSYSGKVFNYIFDKIEKARSFLEKYDVETIIEPGRFLAAPCIKLETKIIQIYDRNIIINTSIYKCALDNLLTNTKMLVEGETNEDNGESYLIKGNSPTRDDIFRYKVCLPNEKVRVGEKIVFMNAGAYNYTTDFFGYDKLRTEIVEDF